MTDLIWSFAPWLAFLLGTRVTSLYGAVAAGVAVAAIVAVRAVARRRLHLLDVAGLCYFLALGAVLVAVDPGHLEFWSRYAQAGSHIALTVIVFGSIKRKTPSLPGNRPPAAQLCPPRQALHIERSQARRAHAHNRMEGCEALPAQSGSAQPWPTVNADRNGPARGRTW